MTIKRIDFSPNQVLTATDLEQVQDNAAVQVSTISELSSLPATVKVAWCDQNDLLYVNTSGSWKPVHTSSDTAWTSYTPTWTASSGTAPSLGNGTLVGQYLKQGPVCHFSIRLTFGSTTSVGTGIGWTWALPFTAAGNAVVVSQGLDPGATLYGGWGTISSGVTGISIVSHATGFSWGYNTPFTWGNTDVISISGTYPV